MVDTALMVDLSGLYCYRCIRVIYEDVFNAGCERRYMNNIRLAAIDIGTNSIRCIVVEVNNQGRYTILDDEKATVRLGENLAASGAISAAAFARAVDAMSRIRKLIDGVESCGG